MNEEKILEKDILINEKIEEIFRNIEAHILKDAMDNFAQRDDEVKGIEKFIEKIDDLRQIYTREYKEFIANIDQLKRRAGLDNASAQTLKSEFMNIITDLNTYENMLVYMKRHIEELTQRLKDEKNRNLITDILNKMHTAYNDYCRLNQLVIDKLKNLENNMKQSNN
ncbi:MAG: hypothetical protein ACP5OA_06215 [Candidatus Woesearchaeota archaeon]